MSKNSLCSKCRIACTQHIFWMCCTYAMHLSGQSPEPDRCGNATKKRMLPDNATSYVRVSFSSVFAVER